MFLITLNHARLHRALACCLTDRRVCHFVIRNQLLSSQWTHVVVTSQVNVIQLQIYTYIYKYIDVNMCTGKYIVIELQYTHLFI